MENLGGLGKSPNEEARIRVHSPWVADPLPRNTSVNKERVEVTVSSNVNGLAFVIIFYDSGDFLDSVTRRCPHPGLPGEGFSRYPM